MCVAGVTAGRAAADPADALWSADHCPDAADRPEPGLHTAYWSTGEWTRTLCLKPRPTVNSSTGYNQSVTGCGSERRHVVVTQRKLI